MDEDHELLMTFLLSGWRDFAVEHGTFKGLRKSKSVGCVLRTLFVLRRIRTFLEEDRYARQNSETLESLGGGIWY